MSALILPQHASDRQMIEKEPRRRGDERRRWGWVGVLLLVSAMASVLKAEQELQ